MIRGGICVVCVVLKTSIGGRRQRAEEGKGKGGKGESKGSVGGDLKVFCRVVFCGERLRLFMNCFTFVFIAKLIFFVSLPGRMYTLHFDQPREKQKGVGGGISPPPVPISFAPHHFNHHHTFGRPPIHSFPSKEPDV
jgi:hypothetical protein